MYDRMQKLIGALTTGLYEREEAVRLGLLAAMAGESVFLLGPPGVGKSLVARRLQNVFSGAKSFSYLMGRFSTPDEVFGPLSIRRLKQDDRYERVVANYLPDADVVFLDEIWKASAPIRNALLTALNERLYRNGTQEIELPLKVFIGASNELPEDDETAAAFWDRFLIRLTLGPIEDDEAFSQLIRDTSDIYADPVPDSDKITPAEYEEQQAGIGNVAVPEPVLSLLLDIRGALQAAGIAVSDRRWKKVVRLLRTAAFLHGRTEIETLDCAIVRHCIWNDTDDRETSESIVRDALSRHAAGSEQASSFAARLTELEQSLLVATVEETEEAIIEPVTYRDEYYRLRPEGPGGDPDSEGEVRILAWHGDIDELADNASGTMDVFRYDSDDLLVGSEEVEVRRTGEWTLEADGKRYAVETRSGIGRVTRTRQPDPSETKKLVSDVRSLVKELSTEFERLIADRERFSDNAVSHLFVGADYAQVVLAAVESTSEEIARTRVRAEQLLETMEAPK